MIRNKASTENKIIPAPQNCPENISRLQNLRYYLTIENDRLVTKFYHPYQITKNNSNLIKKCPCTCRNNHIECIEKFGRFKKE